MNQALQATFQTQVQDYIETQNPDATLGEVLGLQAIKVKPAQPLAAGLPYQLVTAKQTFSTIPAHLRHTFSYSLSQSGYAASMGSSYFTVERSLPELAGKKLALSYKPSTQADEDIILSYLPEVAEGEELDPSQLPSSLPGYLINMTAEFTIDGEVVAEAAVGKMGSEVRDTMQMRSPTGTQFPATGNNVVVGQYHAIGLDLQGISSDQLAALQANMENTKAKLESADTDTTALDSLTRHDVVGDLLQATVQSYFALNDVQDHLMAQASDAQVYRQPSYGKFSTNLNPLYSWGVPKNVQFSGLMMDMDYMLSTIGTDEQDVQRQKTLVQQSGMRLSAMEHLVPEQMFSTDENPAHGISAVKALQIATAEGQRIYTITQANLESALADINLNSSTEQEIRNAVNMGKEVITHTNRIKFYGKITAGYIISDPTNGTGAYKISSGEDGSDLFTPIRGLSELMGMITLNNGLHFLAKLRIIPLMVTGPVGLAFSVIVGLLVVVLAIVNASTEHRSGCNERCSNIQFMDNMSILALMGAALGLLFGGIGALIALSVMVALLIRFLTIELILSDA